MASEPLISDPVDPPISLCGPSLFPRTTRASTDAPMPSSPKDLDSIHHFMNSVGLRSPEKLLEAGKGIVDGGSELLNSNFAALAVSLGINDAALVKANEKPQERRPGLGRKRAQFFFKPNSSQPSESLEPSLDVDQLQDPEEFFAAVEKLEYAKKEIERQKGGSIPAWNENNASQNARRRRPGILGKSVTYKHRYSSVLSENEETSISSQELLEPNVLSAPNSEPHEGANESDVELQEIDVAGSITKTENRVNKILDELLSSNCEDLDGDGALSLLQERLQIKPIELSRLSIPDFHEIGRTNYVALGKNLPKSRRTSLEMQNLLKGTSKEASINHKQMEESPSNSLASPTPPKSPFASISLLKKRILQSNPLRDPFSPLNVDLSTPINLSSVNQVKSQPDEINGMEIFSISCKLKSLTEDGIVPTFSNKPSEKVITGGSDGLADQSMDRNLGRQNPYIDVRPDESHGNLGVHHDGYTMEGKSMDVQSTENTENDDLMDGPDGTKEKVEDGPRQVASSAKEHDSADDSTKSASVTDGHGSSQMEENVEDMPSAAFSAHVDINIEESTPENLKGDQRLFDDSHLATTDDSIMDLVLAVQENDSEQVTEKLQFKDGQQKRQRPPVGRHERKILSRRPSIADAGTFFESGVRRSKRIKMRPLEYWKGERFLYGRVNDSLKLIGLKYISPDKGDGKLKVKSLISHECNELLQLAAKH